MKLAERRERFIDVAEQLFLQHGYSRVSVNEVVRLAGGSLSTLYAEFGNKEALFEAVVHRRVASMFEGIDAVPPGDDAACELRSLARRLQSRMLSEDGLGFYRVATTEAPRSPQLRRAVLDGWNELIDCFAARIAEIAERRDLEIDDARLAAQRLIGLVQGTDFFVAACGAAAAIPPEARERALGQAIDAFLSVYRRRSASA